MIWKRMRPVWHVSFMVVALLLSGCGGGIAPTENAEITGQVTFKGKPLPGGRITFLTLRGSFAHVADIDENGNYRIEAPVGDVKIAVDNRMLKSDPHTQGSPKLKRPGAEEARKLKGKYVAIPKKYYSPEDSGLTYKVENGSQTKNVELK
jgi:hypothetical protein